MDTLSLLSALQRMDQLISFRITGSPAEFARRLGISERTLFSYLTILKDLGACICYNKYSCSYEYQDENRLQIGYL